MDRASRLPPPIPATGDINDDGHVNELDLSILLSRWLSTSATNANLSHDGIVNILDVIANNCKHAVITDWQ